MFFTYHPLEWEEYIKDMIGEYRYNILRQKALSYKENREKINYKELIKMLEEYWVLDK